MASSAMLRYLSSLEGVKSLISIAGRRQMNVNRNTAKSGYLFRKLFFSFGDISFVFFKSNDKVADICDKSERLSQNQHRVHTEDTVGDDYS